MGFMIRPGGCHEPARSTPKTGYPNAANVPNAG